MIRKRRAFALAAGLTATLALVQPVLANTPSTSLAGLQFGNYIGVPGAVSAVIVVPKLDCSGAPSAGSAIYAGVGIQSVNTYARLYLGCTPQKAARYYPSLLVNGVVKDFAGSAVHAGDTIQFVVTQSASKVTDSPPAFPLA